VETHSGSERNDRHMAGAIESELLRTKGAQAVAGHTENNRGIRPEL